MVACLFVVVLVWACGCSSVPGSGSAQAGLSVETPTLPAMYVAGETTSMAGSATITSTPTPPNATAANIFGAQINTTLTEVTISCTGQTCGNITNTTSSNADAPVSSFSANPLYEYVPPNTSNPNVSVQFTDTSTNSPTSWLWRFGDEFYSDQHLRRTRVLPIMDTIIIRSFCPRVTILERHRAQPRSVFVLLLHHLLHIKRQANYR